MREVILRKKLYSFFGQTNKFVKRAYLDFKHILCVNWRKDAVFVEQSSK